MMVHLGFTPDKVALVAEYFSFFFFTFSHHLLKAHVTTLGMHNRPNHWENYSWHVQYTEASNDTTWHVQQAQPVTELHLTCTIGPTVKISCLTWAVDPTKDGTAPGMCYRLNQW